MKNKIRNPVFIALAILLIGSFSIIFYLWNEVQDLKQGTSSVSASSGEVKEIVERVGKIMILPEGEEPVIATVTNPETLKDQAFFADAKVGYKVLIYSKAKKAILYDPESNKIVGVAPINPTQ